MKYAQSLGRYRLSCLLLSVGLILHNTGINQAQGQDETKEISAVITFRDSHVKRLSVENNAFSIGTIAGKVRVSAQDIAAIGVFVPGGNAVVAMHSAERWTVDADALATALLGRKAMQEFEDDRRVIRSISLSPSTRPYITANHGYKVLFKDDSTAIIDPASVMLPVQLEQGDAKLPLGAVSALKFAIPDGEAVPDTIFIRLKSGHIHQYPWAANDERFACESISGNKLSIAYNDILGLLPMIGDSAHASQPVSAHAFRLEHEDGSVTIVSTPLQILTFKTAMGRFALPSSMIKRFTIPQGWLAKGKIETLYGDVLTGRPNFNTIRYEQHGNLESASLSELVSVAQSPMPDSLKLPSVACVVYLADGSIITGLPYALERMINDIDGNVVIPSENSSISRTRSDYYMYSPGRGAPVLSQPLDDEITICLAASGQKATASWDQIDKIEFSRPVQPQVPPTSDRPKDRQPMVVDKPNQRQPDPPRVPVDEHVEQDDDHVQEDAEDDGDSTPSLFSWIKRSDPESDDSSDDDVELIELRLPWGRVDLPPNKVRTVYQQDDKASDILITTRDDVMLVSSYDLKRSNVAELIPDRIETTITSPAFKLPVFMPRSDNPVRIRMTRGDIISGRIVDNEMPFEAIAKSDKRESVPTAMIKRIIHQGDDTLLYETERGNLIAKPIRDKFNFRLAANSEEIEISLNDVESLVTAQAPLPPPIAHSDDRPAALSGQIYLPGGTFNQGSGSTGMSDETPRIAVTLSPFFIDATEITRAQFAAFIEDSGYETVAEESDSSMTWKNPGFLQQPDDPVVCIAWTDAAEFCNWRSKQADLQPVYEIDRDGMATTDRTADGFRLPTESEWEFAAGGARNDLYPWGHSAIPSATALPANYLQREGDLNDGWRWTNPVQFFPPDANGIYGMAGNVWEWCEDWYFDRAYDAFKNRAPLNPCIQLEDVPGLTHRVMRGGSYRNSLDLLRVASRGSGLPLAYAPHVGFRCVRNAN